MADKSFGVRELNLTNTSGTPTVSSPNQLNLSAHTVAISTSVTVGQNLTVSANAGIASLNVTGIGTVLNLNVLGVGTITSPSDVNAHSRWKVSNNGSSAYRFTGPGQDGSENNPNVYLVRGQRYIFDVNASGHPFQLRVANGGAAYSDGVTNNGAQSGQVIFNVQHDAPAQLYYQCTNHGSMVGNIYIVGGPQVIFGVLTATSFSGSGANLTNLPAQATIANNADNRVITGGSGVNLNGEAGLTYNGQAFNVNTVTSENNAFRVYNTTTSATTFQINGEGNSFIGHTYPRSDANLDLGFHSGYRWRDVVLSGGIRFGSNSSDDYLDDYEEGNYDVSITGSSGGSIGMQGNINNLRYTRIGRMVHVTGRIYLNSSSNPSGTARMSLPFTSSANTNDQNGQGYSYVTRYNVYNPNSDYNLIFEIEPNQSYGFFLWDRPGAAWAGVDAGAELNQTACYLGFDFTYTTAT